MKTGQFKIETDWCIFDITEYNNKNVVSYKVFVNEKENVDFAHFYEVEQPVKMKYDPITGELKWHSQQDIGLPELESLLSSLIINHHQ